MNDRRADKRQPDDCSKKEWFAVRADISDETYSGYRVRRPHGGSAHA